MRRGPLYMLVAGLLFAVMLALVKVARTELSPLDTVLWRGLTAVPLALALARPVGLTLVNRRLFAARAAFGFAAMFCVFTAAGQLAVADLSLLAKLQPMLVAVAAPLALGAGERSGRLVWALLIFGFAGSVLILSPQLAIGVTAGLWALAGAVLSACAHVCVRGLARTDNPRTQVFHFQLFAVVVAAAAIALLHGRLPALPSAELWPVVVGTGVSATLGQVCMTRAYAEDRAAVVAAASYVMPVWAVVIDIALFGVSPPLHVAAGGALILTAGLALVFARDRDPAAREATAPPPVDP